MNNAPKISISVRTWAERIAALKLPFDKRALMSASGCSDATAQAMLGKLTADGVIERVSRAWYAAPGVIPKHTPKPGGAVAMARGVQEERARELAAAEAWLADKPALPSASSRAVPYTDRGSRRSA
jgi:hypothetical protein